ncbi:MAG: NAD(P)-dependent oxidoreductase [Opitutaceae bacterium]|nr:NAD(P)-dependent oxidoreductase [Opitutaceae bacterium]
MGSAFAARLLRGGFAVLGSDLESARLADLVAEGGEAAPTIADVWRRCERIVLSLPSHREVGHVLAAGAQFLRPGQVVIDTTTGDPEHSEARAAELSARGVIYLDATVSGSSALVRSGDAVIMVGGDAAAFAACRDVLDRLGCAAFHTGTSGSGAKMKLVTNLVLGLNRAALAEGLALGEAIGLDPALTLAVMRRSPAYSRAMDAKGEKMLASDFAPEARLAQHLKDVRLMIAIGTQAGLPMALSEAHGAVLEQAEAAGLGALDNSAIIQVMRGLAAKAERP